MESKGGDCDAPYLVDVNAMVDVVVPASDVTTILDVDDTAPLYVVFVVVVFVAACIRAATCDDALDCSCVCSIIFRK